MCLLYLNFKLSNFTDSCWVLCEHRYFIILAASLGAIDTHPFFVYHDVKFGAHGIIQKMILQEIWEQNWLKIVIENRFVV